MAETSTISYISAEQGCQKNVEVAPNVQSSPGSRATNSSDVYNNKNASEENVQDFVHEELKASIVLKRKASTPSLTETKRKRRTEDQSDLDPEDPEEKIEKLIIHVDALKAEGVQKDNQIEKLKVELDKKEDEIKKLLAINGRYKSGLACIICTDYLANPCTVNCGHSFCYSCLRQWLETNRDKGPKCPSCRTEITTQPVISYVLKGQVEALVEQLSSEEKERVLRTLEKEDQMYKQISDYWAGIFDRPIRPLLDFEDGVLRCPTCGWEVENSICGNCSQHIDVENRDDNSASNDDDDSDIGNGNESDTYDSNDSFIDDGSDILSADEQVNANESYVIDDDQDKLPHADMNRSSSTIIINDSSSELSEKRSECDSVKKKSVIVISSGEDNNEKSLHSDNSQPTSPLSPLSPLSITLYEENHEIENYNISSDQDGENFVEASSEVEYTYNSDTHISSDEDSSYHVHHY